MILTTTENTHFNQLETKVKLNWLRLKAILAPFTLTTQ